MNNDDIDPNIAELLNDVEDDDPIEQEDSFSSAVDDLQQFNEAQPTEDSAAPEGVATVNLAVHSFDPITKYFEDTPNPVFSDPAYYKTALGGEGDTAQRLHQLLVKYLNCQDKKDRTVYRQQIVAAYWNFLRTLAPKMVNTRVPLCKRLAMRYGVVLPSLFSPEQKDMFSRAIIDNGTGEPVLYMDEWIREVAIGKMKVSQTDEVATRSSGPGAEQQRLQALVGKNSGKLQSSENLVTVKEGQRYNLEQQMRASIDQLCLHEPFFGLEPHTHTYTDSQKKLFSDLMNIFRSLQKIDRELVSNINDLKEAKENIEHLNDKMTELPEEATNVSTEDVLNEMTTIRQMAKMTCGRQGNQYPIFTREFFHCTTNGTGFRENVLRELAWIESLDPNCFVRIHKNMPNRIVPFVLLVPTYGDTGFCWEPFDRYNRITSRGRIVVPMYPRDLKVACLTAVADLRWQVAKEKASFDWMTEGLTGNYYQYIDAQKLKGDLKKFFIDDYILWMTKESTGSQKLPKEVRAIFWRFMPFPQDLKEKLKKMSLAYQELYQRDINRSMSDGY